MQKKYQGTFEYRGHKFIVGLLVGSHRYGIVIDDGNLITMDQQGHPFADQLDDTIRHAEQIIDTLISKRRNL